MVKKRILMIDDEPAFTQMVKFALEKTGRYEVRTENLPVKALDVATEFKPDLVMVDIMMPEMDGSQVAASFKADPKLGRIPLIFMTAIIPKEEINEAQESRGYILYVRKPATLVQIINGIEEALEISQAGEASEPATFS